MNMMEKYNIEETMAFTGHRLIEPGRVEEIKAQLRIKIKALYAKGIRIYLSGMALGFDMLAAEVVLSLKAELPSLKLVAIIPFRNQCNRWNYMSRARYCDILVAADDAIVLSDGFYKGCCLKRNDFMIDHSCGLIAFYDGGYKGGTFYTCKKARAKEKEIINLY